MTKLPPCLQELNVRAIRESSKKFRDDFVGYEYEKLRKVYLDVLRRELVIVTHEFGGGERKPVDAKQFYWLEKYLKKRRK